MKNKKSDKFYNNDKNDFKSERIGSMKNDMKNNSGKSDNKENKNQQIITISSNDFPSIGNSRMEGEGRLSGDWEKFYIGNFTHANTTPKEEEPKKIPRPREIKAFLDQYVIGQEEAKIALSVAVHNHYIRINSDSNDDVEIQKSNILMIGNSGSGKTLLAQTIAKFLDVPFVIFDATTLTPTGIVGKDVEDIAKQLVDAANGDIEKASKGIVYIDEIDKISGDSMTKKSHSVKGVLGGETQSALLKLLEGNEIETKGAYSSMSLFGGSSSKKLNTKNILFICGGAFAGIEEFVKTEEQRNNEIGFMNNNKINKDNGNNDTNKDENIWDKIGTEEIIKYGMMPEIVGRLPVIVKLMPLKRNDLIHILTQPKNALIKQYQKLLDIDGVKLDFSQDALELIADKAIEQKIGARGLRGIVELIMNKIIFNLPDDEYVRKCVVTADCIRNNILPELVLPENKIA